MNPSVARSEKVMALISDRLRGGEDLYDGILETYENTCGEKVDLNDPASLQNFEQTVQGYFGSVILPSNLDLKAIKSQFRVEFLRDGEGCPDQERLKLRNELIGGFQKLFDEMWWSNEEKRDFVVKNLGGSKLVTAASLLETDLKDLYSAQIRNSDIEVLRDLLGIIHDPVKRPVGLKLLQILGYGLINSHGRHSADYTETGYLEQSYIKAVEVVKGLEIKEGLGDKEIKEILAASTAEELLKKIETILPPAPSGSVATSAAQDAVVDMINRAYGKVISILRPQLGQGFDGEGEEIKKQFLLSEALELAEMDQIGKLKGVISSISDPKIVEAFLRRARNDFEHELIDVLFPAYANWTSQFSVDTVVSSLEAAIEKASKQRQILKQKFYVHIYLLTVAEKVKALGTDVMAVWETATGLTSGLIHDSTNIILNITNDLELGYPIDGNVSQVAGYIDMIKDISRKTARVHGVKLEVGELQTDVPQLPPDMRAAFFRIAYEFIRNGMKYSDKGKAERYVRVRFETEGSILRVFFEDNGVGIPEEKREDIWKEGVRLSPELADGYGLGLWSARSLADEHGWKVDIVKSAPGVGSVFMLEMDTSKWEKGAASGPAQAEGGTVPPAPATPAAPAGQTKSASGGKNKGVPRYLFDEAANGQFPQDGFFKGAEIFFAPTPTVGVPSLAGG